MASWRLLVFEDCQVEVGSDLELSESYEGAVAMGMYRLPGVVTGNDRVFSTCHDVRDSIYRHECVKIYLLVVQWQRKCTQRRG